MNLPFFEEIAKGQHILVAGVGGGFDVFAGLPLYFWLREAGKTVHLANLSFTALGMVAGERPVSSLVRVLPGTHGPASYFPELHLSTWLSKRQGETPVYAIDRTGVRPITEAYHWLVNNLQVDTLLLVDGGTDSLMRGDEFHLGTPQEDMASLAAAYMVTGPKRKILACLGFGIDAFHGICHAQFLENVAALAMDGGYLGTWSVIREMEEFRLYEQAAEYATAQTPLRPSIVNTSIVSAIKGHFGDHQVTSRTSNSKLFINPLMGLYWTFRLEQVVRRNLYLDRIISTDTYEQLDDAIDRFRGTVKTREWEPIPV